jgi:hypothetical protein
MSDKMGHGSTTQFRTSIDNTIKAIEKNAQLPVPVGKPQTFTVNGQTYEILRFAKGSKGPNFAQTIEIAKNRGREMLTAEEARQIIANGESNTVFRTALKSKEWGYVRNQESEAEGWTPVAYRESDGALLLYEYALHLTAPVVILKVSAQQAQEDKLLKRINGQVNWLRRQSPKDLVFAGKFAKLQKNLDKLEDLLRPTDKEK